MNRLTHTIMNRILRKKRVRSQIIGTAERPRLSVFVSNQHIHAQLVDDTKNHTLASSTSVLAKTKGSMTEKATWVGEDIAKKAQKAKVTKVVFDRNGRQYHQRLRALADAARAGGLEF